MHVQVPCNYTHGTYTEAYEEAQENKFDPPSALMQNTYPNSQTRTLHASFCCCDQSMLNVRYKDAVLVVIDYNFPAWELYIALGNTRSISTH